MLALLSSLASTPLPTLLCISGVAFLLLAVSGGLSGKITIPSANRKTTAIIGVTLLITGIGIYFVPKLSDPKTIIDTKVDTNTNDPGNPAGTTTPPPGNPITPVHSPGNSNTQSETSHSSSNSQIPLRGYTWTEYGIGFSIPSNFIVKNNTREKFTATGEIFALSIQPWQDSSITDPIDVALAAFKITPGDDKRINSELPLENLNGLKGHVAYITATQNGSLMHAYIAGFINLSNSTNFTAQLAWYDSTAAENAMNIKTATSILKSFKSISGTGGSGNGWKKMTWNAYGIDFQIPADFKVTQSNNNQYTGTTATLVISIKPFKDSSMSDPIKIAQMGLDSAPGSHKSVVSQKNLENLNGFKGHVAYATANTIDEQPTHLVIAGLLNPLNDSNFVVQLMFFDGTETENMNNMNLCLDVLSSFKPRP